MISNGTIKNHVQKALTDMQGWSAETFPETHLSRLHELRTFIELLEIDQCGSTGGFGEGQIYPGDIFNLESLTKRAKWVLAH